jgi:FMN reductase
VIDGLELIRDDEKSPASRPVVVALGGSTRAESTTARALTFCLEAVREFGARTALLELDDLQLPFYTPERSHRTPKARRLVESLRSADALIVATPGYHGSISGLVKNALDYAEDLRDDPRPYLDGVPVGCIVCAAGPQATVTTLVALRSVVHALRGWPTPLGVTLDSRAVVWDERGQLVDGDARSRLITLARQLADFVAVGSRRQPAHGSVT